MANTSFKFEDSAGTYNNYTSNTITAGGRNVDAHRGVIQVEITSGTVELQMRLSEEASFVTVKTYSANTIEEIVVPFQMRIVASAEASAWYGEVK